MSGIALIKSFSNLKLCWLKFFQRERMLAKLLFIALALLAIAIPASAAIIQGSIYSAETFEPLNNAIITVNSVPEQQLVAKDANYSFNLEPGAYEIKARYFENQKLVLEANEILKVGDEGTFSLDLILFPAVEDANLFEELTQDELGNIDLEIPESPKGFDLLSIALATILAALIAIMLYSLYKQKRGKKPGLEKAGKKPAILDKNALEVLQALKERGNRATQKELLEKVHFGEAYLSLVLTELESEGKIKKIKKGRGNIIILKEKE